MSVQEFRIVLLKKEILELKNYIPKLKKLIVSTTDLINQKKESVS